jgi:hypothetical protein
MSTYPNYVSSGATGEQSFITPVGLAFTLAMGVLMLILPRRYALLPVIALTCFMPLGEQVLVLGFHFTMLRLLVAFGWVRVFMRREFVGLKLNPIDTALLWWTLSCLIINTLLWQTADALVYRLGQCYNTIGMYFLFRFVVRDFDDVKRVFKITATLIVPLAAAFVWEWVTGRNAFASFGVVNPIAQVRNGIVRCEGPFAHPILAGTFAATLLPFFVALWKQGRGNKLLAGLAILSSTIITLTAGSSGPFMTYLVAVGAMAMWPLRRYMRRLRWGFALALICLHMVMKAPVWFLIGRADIFLGSTGWHRAVLIDRAITHFRDWWLLGTQSTEGWGYWLHDVTNEYVWEGVNGGLLTLILFLTIIVRSFRAIGRALRALPDQPVGARLCLWALGTALFAHTVTFLSIQYFDQNFVNWYLLLAMISTATGAFISVPKHTAVATMRPYASAGVGAHSVIGKWTAAACTISPPPLRGQAAAHLAPKMGTAGTQTTLYNTAKSTHHEPQ